MQLNIREMISGNPARLRYVHRYSTSRVGCPESVAEHSWFVAFYCLLIARWVQDNIAGDTSPQARYPDRTINTEVLLARAILHDLEEARSGDVPRPFKYSSPQLREMLEVASQMAFLQVMTPVIGPSNNCMPGELEPGYLVADEMYDHWKQAKADDVEGRVLAFADFLAVLGFMVQEKDHGGNKSIAGHVLDMEKYFAGFLKPEYDFIRPLVDQANDIMQEIFNECPNAGFNPQL